VNQPQPGCQSRTHLVVVPQRKTVMRNLGNLSSGARSDCGAGDKGILIGIAAGESPRPSNAAVQTDFVAVSALAAGLHDSGGVVWVGRSGVRAFHSIDRRRKRKRTPNVPLDAEFVVVEFLWFDLLSDRGQRRELVSRAR